jgi:hypothetical protein
MAQNVITIGSNGLFRAAGDFFLLVEVEAKTTGVEIDPVFTIRVTRNQAIKLRQAGVPRLTVQNTVPKSTGGNEVEFKGVFIHRGVAFAVFDVENSEDIAVLVRISVQRARKLIRNGARRIPTILKPFLG